MGGAQQCTKQDSLYFGSAPVQKTMTQLCKLHLFSLSLGLVSENFSVSVSITVPSFPENWWHHWEEKKKGQMTMSDILSFHVERSMV